MKPPSDVPRGLRLLVAAFAALAVTPPLLAEPPKLLHTLKTGQNNVFTLAVSDDGRLLASSGGGGEVQLWDMGTGKVTATLDVAERGEIRSAFGPGGKALATASADHIKLWDAASGKNTATFPLGKDEAAYAVAFRPDGKALASGGWDHAVTLWDVATGKRTAVLKGHTSFVFALAFDATGRRLASGGDDRTLRVWESATGKAVATFEGQPAAVDRVAFAPDGRSLAAAYIDGSARTWDLRSAKLAATLKPEPNLKPEENAATTVGFGPGGAAVALRVRAQAMSLWDVAAGKKAVAWENEGRNSGSVVLSADGKTAAAQGADGTIMVWTLPEEGKAKKEAELPAGTRTFCEQFATDLVAKKDLDGVMKRSALPSFWLATEQNDKLRFLVPKVFRKEEELRALYAAEMKKFGATKGAAAVISSNPYGDFLRKARPSERERQGLDEVLAKDDWVVTVRLESEDATVYVALLVARRDGQDLVAGLLRSDVVPRPTKK